MRDRCVLGVLEGLDLDVGQRASPTTWSEQMEVKVPEPRELNDLLLVDPQEIGVANNQDTDGRGDFTSPVWRSDTA